ncbi:MAG: hypothetical protein KKH40_02160 [Nanoarchaeota archaeon]|nr:hypothetical protein [Nanoarchaeota archaeon]
MDRILTLNKINRSDTQIAGFVGVDLAEMFNKKISTPLCFVISTKAFDSFLEDNSLKVHLDCILSKVDFESDESLKEAYTEIKDFFENLELSEDFQNELLEAYDTLTIDIDNFNVAKLVTAIERPFTTFITSPSYISDSGVVEGVITNVKSKTAFFRAVKDCWISLYTPKALKYRKKNNIGNDVKAAIVVQKMIDSEICVECIVSGEKITVMPYFGLPDYKGEIEKDEMVFSKTGLNLLSSKINYQEFMLERDIRDNVLTKKSLKDLGSEQKLNDKDASEVARFSKKAYEILKKPIKVYFGVRKSKYYLLHTYRITETVEEKENKQEYEIKEAVETNIENKETENEIDKVNLKTFASEEDKEENNHDDPDAEDFGITVEEVPIEDDLAFLEEIEILEKKEKSPVIQEELKETTSKIEDESETIIDVSEDENVCESQKNETTVTVEKPKKNADLKEELSDYDPFENFSLKKNLLDENVVVSKESDEEDDGFLLNISSKEEKTEKQETKQEITEAEQEVIKPKEDDEDNLNADEELQKIVKKSLETITERIKKKYFQILSKKSEDLTEMIGELKTMICVPFEEDIIEVQAFLNKKDLDFSEAEFSLRVAKKFAKEF